MQNAITYLIMGAVSLIAIAVIIEVAILIMEQLIEWFRGIKTTDVNALGFTIKEEMVDGKYSIIQGVFDKDRGKILTIADEKKRAEEKLVRRIRAQELDGKVAQLHSQKTVVLYT